MLNPLKLVATGLKGVLWAGKTLGKAQKLFHEVSADMDGDGTPEYKEALNGLVTLAHKFQYETLPLLKQAFKLGKDHFYGYIVIFTVQVLPNIKAVFKAAREASKN